MLVLYGECLTPRPNPKVENHSTSDVRYCLFDTSPVTLRLLNPPNEDVPCRDGPQHFKNTRLLLPPDE
jgi:hypothetical protein